MTQPAPSTLRRWRNRADAAPLRLRLVALLIVLLIAALAITGLAATMLLKSYLLERQDAELFAARGPLVNAALESQANPGTQDVPAYVPTGVYVVRLQWSTNEHTDVFSTDRSVPNWPDLSPSSQALTEQRPFTLSSEDHGSDWRVVAGTTNSTTRGAVSYAVAVSLDSVDETVDTIQTVIALVGLAVVLIGAAAGWVGIRRLFRPLAQIEDTAAAIAGGDLSKRVAEPAGNDEVASLAHSLNAMLARIEESFTVRERSEDRMRQFVQDASHELRTPLATVRGYAELYRHGAVSKKEDVDSAVRRIEDEATRMGAMVDSLLLLNRLDEQHGERLADDPTDLIDLTVIAGDAVQDAKARDHDRQIQLLGLDGPVGQTFVRGSDSQLRQVLANLLGNALRYSPHHTPIEVLVGQDATSGVVHVRDHGPGIPSAQHDRVFERFYRADESRNSATGGSGLGLAIVEAIAQSHHGAVTIQETPGGGATFVLRIPLAQTDA